MMTRSSPIASVGQQASEPTARCPQDVEASVLSSSTTAVVAGARTAAGAPRP